MRCWYMCLIFSTAALSRIHSIVNRTWKIINITYIPTTILTTLYNAHEYNFSSADCLYFVRMKRAFSKCIQDVCTWPIISCVYVICTNYAYISMAFRNMCALYYPFCI